MSGPDLSIIIVSYNARADLERCVSSLAAAPFRAAHEVIVVDNASADGSADAARTMGVRVIDAGANVGFARANFAAKGWAYYSHNSFFWSKIGTFALVGVLSIIPTIAFSGYHLFQLTMVAVYAVAILGMAILVGFNGQISLGSGAFYAIGAYTTAILMTIVKNVSVAQIS